MRASVTAAAALALSGLASAANITEWKSRSIYQVMIDRFALTDGSTTEECVVHQFCGGTWKGLMNKLDYIQDMGFTAIQISPVVKNIEEHTSVGDAYHGYWSQDNYALNEHFGTEQDFEDLVAEVHKRDMLLMLDVVVNNMAQAFDNVVPPKLDYSKFNPFNDEKYFHPYCNVTDWEDPENYQNCWFYPYGVALADLNTESDAVSDELNSWVKGLVANYSIDGIRIDAAKHVNDEFLPKFVEASGVFALGEVLTGLTQDMCRYQTLGLLPGMPNYLEYYPLLEAFNGGTFENVTRIRDEAATGCNDTLALGSFIENHDMPRFASRTEDLALAKNAMTYILLTDGIPTVYQGQEQHFKGNSTPFNREPLWSSGYNKSAPLYVLTSTLNKLRNNAIKLSSEYISTPAETLHTDVNHLCLRKGPDGTQIVFCVTNKSSSGDSYEMTVGGFQPNQNVVEVLSCKTSTANGVGTLTMYMGKGEPKVYVPAAALKDTGICGTTTADGPVSGAAAVRGTGRALLAALVVGWGIMALA
ncbi:glycoside hydrolase family 13 protein [Canariomyces notabilis]|uniref:alpha-amylase n=1 Tax=Canariomyces notabilis TaxID=2074819 RepID=A0AAN6YSJ0_9PEZI|nr:glycoside hydrolase family 13 protein [Canariomyces arenarius]